MFLTYFLPILILQMLCYALIDYWKIKFGRIIVLVIFLSIYFLILPNLYLQEESKVEIDNGIGCCNCVYIFDYFQELWFAGVGFVLSAHLIYCFLISRKVKVTE
jgi:hypothetical protein